MFKKLLCAVAASFLIFAFSGCIRDIPDTPVLDAEYYQTQDGKTVQLFPEADWPIIIDSNASEPLTVAIILIWVDETVKSVVIVVDDEATPDVYGDTAGMWFVKSTEKVSTTEYLNVDILGFQPLDVDRVLEALRTELAK